MQRPWAWPSAAHTVQSWSPGQRSHSDWDPNPESSARPGSRAFAFCGSPAGFKGETHRGQASVPSPAQGRGVASVNYINIQVVLQTNGSQNVTPGNKWTSGGSFETTVPGPPVQLPEPRGKRAPCQPREKDLGDRAPGSPELDKSRGWCRDCGSPKGQI